MCGIFGVLARRNTVPLLLDGLARLEYRGYDSAGIAVLGDDGALQLLKTAGKVDALRRKATADLSGQLGIAHTRWATHGPPSEQNAHPHACAGRLALVHNGIVENHEQLRREQQRRGCHFHSSTDTEVIVHELDHCPRDAAGVLPQAAQQALGRLKGSYAVAVLETASRRLLAARRGSPLLIGLGQGEAEGEYYIASDLAALLPLTRRYLVLEDGDLAELREGEVRVYDDSGRLVNRPVAETRLDPTSVDKGAHRHYMLKEIYEQPHAVRATLESGLRDGRLRPEAWSSRAPDETEALLSRVRRLQLVACGTSYHAALIAAYWLEKYVRLPCRVEIASEFRYRNAVVEENTLFVCISQSGETADTLAALRCARERGYLSTLGISNTPQSALAREVQLLFLTHAGPERGVASTKAFTAQLAALQLLTLLFAKAHGRSWEALARSLEQVPERLRESLLLEQRIADCAPMLATARHILFLGRGLLLPVAMEGALKLKEISYLQAECHPAGELKHGPLALVEPGVQVVVPIHSGKLLPKLRANLEEVKARGGALLLFADPQSDLQEEEHTRVIHIPPAADDFQAPLLYIPPLQLLAYHVALRRGTDIDQPRNLAKSVTVE